MIGIAEQAQTMTMTSKITLDFETRSKADLKKVGAYKYSMDPSTDVLCLAFKSNKWERPERWNNLKDNTQIPLVLASSICEDDTIIEAHNAFFEWCIWNNIMVRRYNWPSLPIETLYCSAAKAAALALPRGLADLCKALELPVEKDMKGHRLMLKMSKPRKPTKNDDSEWHEKPEELERLYNYCDDDTISEEAASEIMPELIPQEREVFLLDHKINVRGIYCDVPLVETCLEFIEKYTETLTDELIDITQGEVTTANQLARIRKFCENEGFVVESLDKDSIEKALEEKLPVRVRKILEIRQKLGRSSASKFKKMLEMANEDYRIRGTLIYHGGHTGRWSGKGIQPHNFLKGSIDDVDTAVELLEMGDFDFFCAMYSDPLGAITSCVRSMLCAEEGKRLLVADYNAIEARVLMWLSDEKVGLDAFINDKDIYKDMASSIYSCSLDSIGPGKRTLGKQAVLGCGFQMGKDKFWDTCVKYGIKISKELAERSVKAYREKYKKVVEYWYKVEKAAIRAVQFGTLEVVNNIRFKKVGRWLYIKLPSGRKLAYYKPHLKEVTTSWGAVKTQLRYYAVDSTTKKFTRHSTYGGKLVENIVQAVARDIMAEAMIRLEKKNYPIVMSIHDELIIEKINGLGSMKEFTDIMTEIPKWAVGCPIKVEGWEGKRYKK